MTQEYIQHACIKRNDGVLAIGRSHSEIINYSPYGTCKNIQEKDRGQGFLTNTGRYVSRLEAFDIAYESGMISEDLYDNACPAYLLSEYLWADSGWDYSLENGYFKDKK